MAQALILRAPGVLSNPKQGKILLPLPTTPDFRYHADLYSTTADGTALTAISAYNRTDRDATVTGSVTMNRVAGKKTFKFATASTTAQTSSFTSGKTRTLALLAYFTGNPTETQQLIRSDAGSNAALACQPSVFMTYGTSGTAVTSGTITISAGWYALVAVLNSDGTGRLVFNNTLKEGPLTYAISPTSAIFRMAGLTGGLDIRQSAFYSTALDASSAIALSQALLADVA